MHRAPVGRAAPLAHLASLFILLRHTCQTTRVVKEAGLYEGVGVLRNTKHRPPV